MTTIVNTPPAQKESGDSMGMIIGVVAIIVIGYLFFAYGLPAMRNAQLGTPQINIPAQVNVNVTPPKQ